MARIGEQKISQLCRFHCALLLPPNLNELGA
jgi:hypothetical protein